MKHQVNNRLARQTVAALAVLISVAIATKAAVNLLQTDAAAAFKAGDYQRAAQEFARLASENPEDVTLLRYLGITLRKLERYQDALTVFQKALTLAPGNVAVNYHTAVTLYKGGALDAAVQSFKTVLQLAPDSKYAGLANEYLSEYLSAISDQLARAQRPAEPKQFGFYGQLAYQYDSNALAIPDSSPLSTSDRDANRFTGYLSGQYFFLNRNGWLGTVDFSGYGAGYAEDRLNNADIRQLNPGISIQKVMQFGGIPAVNSIRYDYLDVKLDGDRYSKSHVMTIMSRLTFTPRTGTRISYRYTRDDFANEGFDPAFSSRDADNHTISVLNTWYLHDRKVELDLGASYIKNNADGVNFNSDTWRIGAAARFSLPKQLWLELSAAWASDEYPDFAGPMKRETDITDVKIALRRWFKARYLVELNATWHDESSSYESLTYDRYGVGLNFSYAY